MNKAVKIILHDHPIITLLSRRAQFCRWSSYRQTGVDHRITLVLVILFFYLCFIYSFYSWYKIMQRYIQLNKGPSRHSILLYHHSHHRDNVTAPYERPNLRSRLHCCHAQEGEPRIHKDMWWHWTQKKIYIYIYPVKQPDHFQLTNTVTSLYSHLHHTRTLLSPLLYC